MAMVFMLSLDMKDGAIVMLLTIRKERAFKLLIKLLYMYSMYCFYYEFGTLQYYWLVSSGIKPDDSCLEQHSMSLVDFQITSYEQRR